MTEPGNEAIKSEERGCLVLTRKLGQRFFLTGGIEIQVARTKGNETALRIIAPIGIRASRPTKEQDRIDFEEAEMAREIKFHHWMEKHRR